MRASLLTFAACMMLSPLPLHAFAETDDVVRGPIDPYDAGDERRRFLAAAGVDGELDEREFKSNQTVEMPFVRKFDQWSSLKAFDKNNNQTLDWFEVDGYRNALRDAVLLAHDKNKDSRLTDEERTAANRELALGRAPRLNLPGGAADERGAGRQAIDWDTNGDGKMDDQEREAYTKRMREQQARYWADYTKKWDADGDGQLSQAEHEAARKAQWDEWKEKNPEQAARHEAQQAQWKAQQEEYVRKWDANGDGQLDADERATAQKEAVREWRENNPEAAARWDEQQAQQKKQMEEYVRRWDSNGDGKVEGQEQKDAMEHFQAEGRKRYAEHIQKWDADGDGKLSPEENKAASDAAVKDWREKNPEAAARWDKQQEEWLQKQKERLEKFDADGDGKLNGEEWRKALESERGQSGGTGGFRAFGQ